VRCRRRRRRGGGSRRGRGVAALTGDMQWSRWGRVATYRTLQTTSPTCDR
jgi:hypothetical protein